MLFAVSNGRPLDACIRRGKDEHAVVAGADACRLFCSGGLTDGEFIRQRIDFFAHGLERRRYHRLNAIHDDLLHLGCKARRLPVKDHRRTSFVTTLPKNPFRGYVTGDIIGVRRNPETFGVKPLFEQERIIHDHLTAKKDHRQIFAKRPRCDRIFEMRYRATTGIEPFDQVTGPVAVRVVLSGVTLPVLAGKRLSKGESDFLEGGRELRRERLQRRLQKAFYFPGDLSAVPSSVLHCARRLRADISAATDRHHCDGARMILFHELRSKARPVAAEISRRAHRSAVAGVVRYECERHTLFVDRDQKGKTVIDHAIPLETKATPTFAPQSPPVASEAGHPLRPCKPRWLSGLQCGPGCFHHVGGQLLRVTGGSLPLLGR